MAKRPKSPLTWNALCALDKNYTKPIRSKALKSNSVDWPKLSKTDPQWLCHPVALRTEQFVADIVKKSEFSDVMSVCTQMRMHNNKPDDLYDEKNVVSWAQVMIFISKYGSPFGENLYLSTDYLRTCGLHERIYRVEVEKRVDEIFDYYKKHYKNIIAFFRSTAKLVDEISKRVPLYDFNTKPLSEDGCIEVGFGDSMRFVSFNRETGTVAWTYRDSKSHLQRKRKLVNEATAEEIVNSMI